VKQGAPLPEKEIGDATEVARPISIPVLSELGLLLGDALVAGLVAPAMAVLFLGRTRTYIGQMMLAIVGVASQPLAAEGLIHEAFLATSWVAAVLLTGSLGGEAVDPKDLRMTLMATWKAASVSACLVFVGVSGGLLLACSSSRALGLMGTSMDEVTIRVFLDLIVDVTLQVSCLVGWRLTSAMSRSEMPNSRTSIMDRVFQPEVEDLGVLIGDVLVAGALVPGIIVTFLVQTEAYTPEWMILGGFAERGQVVPAVSHGATLAACWVVSAVLTGAFEAEVVYCRDLGATLKLIAVTGIIASVLVILVTGVSLLFFTDMPHSGNYVDFEAYRSIGKTVFDLILDISLSASCLTAWRLKRAGFI